MKKSGSTVFARHILSAFMVASLALAASNMAAAADKRDQPLKGCLDKKSVNVANDDQGEPAPWEHSLQADGVAVVEAQVYVGNTCYTSVGSCVIYNGPLPVGTPCWCGGYFGRVGMP